MIDSVQNQLHAPANYLYGHTGQKKNKYFLPTDSKDSLFTYVRYELGLEGWLQHGEKSIRGQQTGRAERTDIPGEGKS